MKKKSEIVAKIQEAIEEVSLGEIPVSRATPESRLIGDLGMDSLDYASVMLAVERWSGIKIREDSVDWSAVQTVDQLADLFIGHQQ